MTVPKLTVLILAKNEEQNLTDCINSVKFADEILVIDDGSTDKTKEVAATYARRHEGLVRVMRLDKNRGKGISIYIWGH